MSQLLGTSYKELYDGYYGGEKSEKRLISAKDSVDHLKRLVDGEQFSRTIDVGAGEGSALSLLDQSEQFGDLYGLEISTSGVQAIQARNLVKLKECRQFDGYEIPYEDKFFDLAIMMHVLEHVEHERLVLKEIRRVARRVAIIVPLENHARVGNSIATSGPYGHINFYRPETLINLVRTCDLKVIRAEVVSSSLQYEIFVAGRIRGFVKYHIRNGALKISQGVATSLFTYVGGVYCDAS